MTDPSMTPETPGIAETANFLRRFADMMSVGKNASYLNHAAVLIEDLTARLTAALDEEQLWRFKYETVTHHADELEAECEALKNDIDGHLTIIVSTIAERDTLKASLQAREAELAGLRAAFDREREALNAAAEARGEEIDQLRRQLAGQGAAHEAALAELRLGFGRERDELAARLKVSGDELAALRLVSEREHEALRAKVAALESKRAELRSAFDRISQLKDRAGEPQTAAGGAVSGALEPESTAPSRPAPAVGDADVVVPRATLRQVRSQFEYLASEFTGAGDVASQVMCELGAFTMELALGAGRKADPLPVGDVALSILASPGAAAAGAETR
jgi:hypothetical protein